MIRKLFILIAMAFASFVVAQNNCQPPIQVQTTNVPNTTVCNGTTFTFQIINLQNAGSNYTLQWLKNGSPISGENGMTFTSNTLAHGDYIRVRVTNTVQGCYHDSNAYNISIDPNINLDFNLTSSVVNNVVCVGLNVTLNANFVQSSHGSLTYTWEGHGVSGSGNQKNVTFTSPGTYTYQVTASNGQNCSKTKEITITVIDSQTPTFSFPTTFCQYSTPITLPSKSDNNINGTWSPATINTTTPGEYTYIFTPAPNSCGDTKNVKITITPKPVLTVSPTQIICVGESVTLTASGASTYVWVGGEIDGKTGSQQTVTPASQSNAYMVIGTDANGCTNEYIIGISVLPKPNVFLTANKYTICPGEEVILTASGNGITYNWDNGLGNGGPFTRTVNPTVTTTYEIVGIDVAGCQNTASVEIVVQKPIITLQTDVTNNEICEGESVKITVSGASTYAWTANGVPISGNQNEKTFSPTISTTYKVVGTDSIGCVSEEIEVT